MALSFFSPLTGKVLHFVFSCPSCVQLYELSQETVGESCSRERGARGEFKSQILFLWKVCVNDSSVMLKSKGNRLQNQPTILTSDHFGLYFTFFLHYEKDEKGMMKYLFCPLEKHTNYFISPLLDICIRSLARRNCSLNIFPQYDSTRHPTYL